MSDLKLFDETEVGSMMKTTDCDEMEIGSTIPVTFRELHPEFRAYLEWAKKLEKYLKRVSEDLSSGAIGQDAQCHLALLREILDREGAMSHSRF
jgi:hypothetical protein